MEFKRTGKSFQMVIQNGDDLKETLYLDEALWMALSAPVNAFHCDPKIPQLMDTEKKGRITTTDFKQAVRWLFEQIPNARDISLNNDENMKLACISDTSETGKKLLESASYILQEIKAEQQTTINLQQVRDFIATVIARPLNGDGVLTLKAAQTAAHPQQVSDLINDVITANGGAKDLDGTLGLDEATLKAFIADIKPQLEWREQGKIPEGSATSTIMSMGPDTPALSALLMKQADKVDHFFKLCKLLDFDTRLLPKGMAPETKVATFDPAQTTEVTAYQDALPIASPQTDCLLPLDTEKINPTYRDWFNELLHKILLPLLGDTLEALSQADWDKVKATFAPYQAYLAAQKGTSCAKISEEHLKFYDGNQPLLDEVAQLIIADKHVADIVTGAQNLEKLLLYRNNLIILANNFVSFADLYDTQKHALFECGKLVIDGRWFTVAFQVDTIASHLAASKSSLLFLMYLEVQTPKGPMNVVVPVTSGSKGNLMPGKRGIFYDLQGNDCDAKIVQIVENPVCIREAMLAPLTRLWSIVETKLTAWSADSEKKMQANFTTAISTPPTAPAPPANKPKTENSNKFMGIGIAAAAIGSSLALITKTLASLSGFQIWMTVLVAILALMLPVTIIACIKLNRQDLSSILEGCGWGINLKVGLNTKLRNQFTTFGQYPIQAKGTPCSCAFRWLFALVLLIVICYGGCKFYQNWQNRKVTSEKAAAIQEEFEKKQTTETSQKSENGAPSTGAAPTSPAGK